MFYSPCLSLPPPPPESPTVMLAAGSFSSPYEHLSQPETKRMVEHYTAYLSDNTRLIANPGLKVCTHAHTHASTHTHTHRRHAHTRETCTHIYGQTQGIHSNTGYIHRYYRHMITYREYTHTHTPHVDYFGSPSAFSLLPCVSASGGKNRRGWRVLRYSVY